MRRSFTALAVALSLVSFAPWSFADSPRTGPPTTPAEVGVVAGATAGTFAAGNDPRILGAMQKSANLSDVASLTAARQSLELSLYSGPQLSVVATKGNGLGLGRVQDLTGTGAGYTYLSTVYVPNPVASPRLAFANYWHNTEGDVSNTNDLPIRASVSTTLSGTRWPVYFNRSNGITLPGNQTQPQVYESDPLPLTLPAGTLYVRVFCNPGNNLYIPVGTTIQGATLGDGTGRGNGDLTASGTVGAYDGQVFGPVMVRGHALPTALSAAGYISRKATSVALCGDSIDVGFGQQEPGGWLAVGVGNSCGYTQPRRRRRAAVPVRQLVPPRPRSPGAASCRSAGIRSSSSATAPTT